MVLDFQFSAWIFKTLRWTLFAFCSLFGGLLVTLSRVHAATSGDSATAMEAGGQLSLSAAVSEALEQSPQVQRSKSAYQESSWKKKEAYAGFLPTVGLSAEYLFDKKYVVQDFQLPGAPAPIAIPEIVPTTALSLKAYLPLYDGLENFDRLSAGQKFEQSAKNDYEWAQYQLEREVSLQFYRALAAQTLKEVAEQNVKVLEDHLKDVTQFRRAGISTNYDVLRVEVQVSEARSELMNATDNVVNARTKLIEILGRDEDDRSLAGELPVLSPDLVEKSDLKSTNERKDLDALQEKSSALKSLDSAASSYLLPHLGLTGEYQYYNNINDNAFDGTSFRNAYTIGIELTWNIFDGMTSISKSHETAEQKYQADRSLRVAVLKAKQDLSMWRRKYLYYCSVYKSRLADIGKAAESVRLAKEGRRAGTRTNTDLLDAESDKYRAQAEAVNAQIGAIEALINLELTTGKKLYQFN